jgi:methanethiol S-methyltransferase
MTSSPAPDTDGAGTHHWGAATISWLGAAAFVLSLLYFLYFYYINPDRIGAAPRDGWVASLAVNLLLFTVFAGHHSVMARSGAKTWLARHVPPALERTVYVWVSSILFLIVCVSWRPLPGVLYSIPWPWSLLNYLVSAAGLALALVAARRLNPLELAGVSQAAGGSTPVAFTAVGPYRLVRHPIYLGWILMVFGSPHMSATRLSFAVISTLYLLLAIPLEERSLDRAFGDEYGRYRRQVPSRVLPFVY